MSFCFKEKGTMWLLFPVKYHGYNQQGGQKEKKKNRKVLESFI